MLNIGASEVGVLLVVGLLMAGPERMPSLVRDAARGVRKFRAGVNGMTTQLREESGIDIDELRSLHPRRLLQDELAQSGTPWRTNVTASGPSSDNERSDSAQN
jgi:sec-independent protein translocase protein TatB